VVLSEWAIFVEKNYNDEIFLISWVFSVVTASWGSVEKIMQFFPDADPGRSERAHQNPWTKRVLFAYITNGNLWRRIPFLLLLEQQQYMWFGICLAVQAMVTVVGLWFTNYDMFWKGTCGAEWLLTMGLNSTVNGHNVLMAITQPSARTLNCLDYIPRILALYAAIFVADVPISTFYICFLTFSLVADMGLLYSIHKMYFEPQILSWCRVWGHLKQIKWITWWFPKFVSKVNHWSQTALMLAATSLNEPVVDYLLKQPGVDITAICDMGKNALHYVSNACVRNDEDRIKRAAIYKKLLNACPQLEEVLDKWNVTPRDCMDLAEENERVPQIVQRVLADFNLVQRESTANAPKTRRTPEDSVVNAAIE